MRLSWCARPAGAGPGLGLVSLFPRAVSSPAWPRSLKWPLVVDGPRAERRGGIGYLLAPEALVPGAWVLGAARRLQGAHLQRVALPGLSVAGRLAVSRLCGLHGLRHTGLGVLSQSQEMDLRTGAEAPLPWAAGVNPSLLAVHATGGLAWV